ncbi:Teneurin-3, partial [Galemys pyrenaicus]
VTPTITALNTCLFSPPPPPLLPCPSSSPEICAADCGGHGVCVGGACRCEDGWMGAACDQRACHPRCTEHGTCHDGKCECSPGWNGEHCTIEGCPGLCNGNGRCTLDLNGWHCVCQLGWRGAGCDTSMETACGDSKDNDGGRVPAPRDPMWFWGVGGMG